MITKHEDNIFFSECFILHSYLYSLTFLRCKKRLTSKWDNRKSKNLTRGLPKTYLASTLFVLLLEINYFSIKGKNFKVHSELKLNHKLKENDSMKN